MGCNTVSKNKKEVITQKIIKIDESIVVHKDSLELNGNEGNWYYKKQLYNGYAVKYYPNDSLKEKTGFFNGKKQGVYKVWFKNGAIKLTSNYNQNVLMGNYSAWWINGTKALNVEYKKGKKEGVELQWYSNGVMSKKRHLVAGKEKGLQQAWLENGTIYVNYEARNGRIFGMRKANLCYQLKNEKIEESKKI